MTDLPPAMNLAREDWASVLKLLDDALDLPAARRAAWLDALDPDLQRLRPALRELLDQRRAIETGSFLQALPPLEGLAPEAGFAAGHRIGPYALLHELGHGGMASVWLAERADAAHGRQVALKLPHLGARARILVERFARERQILSALTHPHIASVLDAGVDGAQPWLAMEFVQGVTITEWAAQQQLGVRARLQLFVQVLGAVQHAHAQLVIHRDIKPGNVLVDADGQVKLLDFGVAKLLGDDGASRETELTRWGGRAMTPQYASPEQVAGLALGTASDVYSLGVLLYELLTGRLPYVLARDTPAAVEEAILAAHIVAPSAAVADRAAARALRGDIDTIVTKALAPQPAQRYTSAESMAQDIERHLQSLPIQARPAGLAYRLRKTLRRHRVAAGFAATLSLALAGGLAATLWQAREAQAQARKARAVSQFLTELFSANSANQADPLKAQQTPAIALMDAGADRIRQSLRDDPMTAQDLLETVAALYLSMGRDDRGEQMQAQRVDVVRRHFPNDDALLAEALVSHAGGLWEVKQLPAMRATLDEAGALLDRLGDHRSTARGNWHFLRGDLLRQEDVPGAALPDYEKALAIFEREEARVPGSATYLQHLLVTLAQEYHKVGRREPANATLDRALARVDTLATTSPPQAAMTWSVTGRVRQGNGDLEGAEQALRRAIELYRRSGGDEHPGIPGAQLSLAQLLFALGRRDEALALGTQLIEANVRRHGADGLVTLNAEIYLARSRQLIGDMVTARRSLERALDKVQAMPGQSVRVAAASLDLAGVLCTLGERDGCAAALQRAEQAAPQAIEKSERLQWQREGVRARLAAADGRWADARAADTAALAMAERSGQVAGWEKLATRLNVGADALRSGDPAAAEAAISAVQSAIAADVRLQAVRPLRAQLLARVGELRLQQRRWHEAEAALAEAVHLREQTDVPGSPWLADVRTLLATARQQGAVVPADQRSAVRLAR